MAVSLLSPLPYCSSRTSEIYTILLELCEMSFTNWEITVLCVRCEVLMVVTMKINCCLLGCDSVHSAG
jgi:hypothetical protein